MKEPELLMNTYYIISQFLLPAHQHSPTQPSLAPAPFHGHNQSADVFSKNRVVVMHGYDPSTWEPEAGGLVSSRLAYATSQDSYNSYNSSNATISDETMQSNSCTHTLFSPSPLLLHTV